jgi:hypothetical protein
MAAHAGVRRAWMVIAVSLVAVTAEAQETE